MTTTLTWRQLLRLIGDKYSQLGHAFDITDLIAEHDLDDLATRQTANSLIARSHILVNRAGDNRDKFSGYVMDITPTGWAAINTEG